MYFVRSETKKNSSILLATQTALTNITRHRPRLCEPLNAPKHGAVVRRASPSEQGPARCRGIFEYGTRGRLDEWTARTVYVCVGDGGKFPFPPPPENVSEACKHTHAGAGARTAEFAFCLTRCSQQRTGPPA